VQLQETDAAVIYAPAGDFAIDVTDQDGSEQVDSVTYVLTGVPDGTSWTSGSRSGTATGGTLTFEGDLAEFEALEIGFPADFASNGTPIEGAITVTTNEGGVENGAFEISVTGERDLEVSAASQIPVAETGAPIVVAFGIEAEITPDAASNPWETLDEVVVTFSSPLPEGVSASAGSFNTARDTLTYTRGSTDTATFAAMVAALAITLPAGTASALDGQITVSTNHGTSAPQPFEVALNNAPVPGPEQSFEILGQTSATLSAADLLTGTTDPEGNAFALANPVSDDPELALTLNAEGDIEVTVPAGYVGAPVLRFEIVDDGTPAASVEASATLEIDTLQMVDTGETDAEGRAILSDVTGQAGGDDIAKATDGDDAVIVNDARPYDGIAGFTLGAGDDLIDLSGAARGFTADGGAGDDVLIGSAFDDTLTGGEGADTLTGGDGDDVFALTGLTVADVITDYTGGEDRIDLSALLSLEAGEAIDDRARYEDTTGALSVDGVAVSQVVASAGGLPESVEIIFEDAAGQQQSAVI
jgi:Ca2+-binding RTX toxin-like protein